MRIERWCCPWVIGIGAMTVCCAPAPRTEAASPSAASAPSSTAEDEELERVARIHGAPGPWAVSGYRMGRYALAKLGLPPGSFDLEIIHHTPRQVMYSCIADGAAAATGASVGKLNLSLVDSRAEDVETTYRRKSTGQAITLRPTAKFRARYADAPRERARELGREVLRLAEAEVFEEVPSAGAASGAAP
jgi:formylmethanofuran dehydrogenase subunit E